MYDYDYSYGDPSYDAYIERQSVGFEFVTASGRYVRFEFDPDDDELWCGLQTELEENENYWDRALATYADGPPIVAPTCAYLDSDLSRDELEDLLCRLYGL
jgi:hypothetical protein